MTQQELDTITHSYPDHVDIGDEIYDVRIESGITPSDPFGRSIRVALIPQNFRKERYGFTVTAQPAIDETLANMHRTIQIAMKDIHAANTQIVFEL